MSTRIANFKRYPVSHYIARTAIEIFLVLTAITMLFPMFYILITSGKNAVSIANSPFALPNSMADFVANYMSALTGNVTLPGGFVINLYTPFLRALFNTVILVVLSLVFMIVCATPIGYALGRRSFRGKNAYMMFVILIQVVPLFGYLTAFYYLMDKMQMTNNIPAMALIYASVSMPTSIIFMKGFYSGFPIEVEEAAEIDGAGEFRRFIGIVLPMSKGIIASIMMVSFMGYWNEYAIASLLITEPLQRTISMNIMMSGMGDTVYQTYVFPLLFLSALPTLIFFTIFQKSITQGGLSLGSIKG